MSKSAFVEGVGHFGLLPCVNIESLSFSIV